METGSTLQQPPNVKSNNLILTELKDNKKKKKKDKKGEIHFLCIHKIPQLKRHLKSLDAKYFP